MENKETNKFLELSKLNINRKIEIYRGKNNKWQSLKGLL